MSARKKKLSPSECYTGITASTRQQFTGHFLSGPAGTYYSVQEPRSRRPISAIVKIISTKYVHRLLSQSQYFKNLFSITMIDIPTTNYRLARLG